MTVIVGVRCEDGVVIGSDSSTTLAVNRQFRTIEQPAQKTFIIGNDVVFAGTGQVGLGQRFAYLLSQVREKSAKDWRQVHPLQFSKAMSAHTIDDFASTKAKEGQFGALVAFSSQNEFHLCEFAIDDFQPELKTGDRWFVSMGSGQPIADPFLGLIRRVFFKDSQPRLNEGIFAVLWTLEHAIDLNTGGIDGPAQIGILTNTDSDIIARFTDQ